MLFNILFMCPFSVVMDGGRRFIRYTARLVHVEKWNFLMHWKSVLRKGIDIAAWYHFSSYGLVISASQLGAAYCA